MLRHCFRLALLSGVLLAWPGLAGAQTVKPQPKTTRPAPAVQPIDTAKVYTFVEQMPQPAGGMEGLVQYLGRNFKYPCILWRPGADIPDRILVRFIVRRNGRISDVAVVNSITAPLDDEAVRVVSHMPSWTPGRQNGQLVNVQYTIPIRIEIR